MSVATSTAIAIAAGAGAGASIFGAHKASSASKKAAEQQTKSAQEALALQRDMFGQTRGDLAPYREQGGQGLTALSSLLQTGPGAFQADPGYQFRLNEGLQALQRSAAARGTLLTGGTLKGLERFAQDYASGEYDKFQNRYNTRVNQYAGLAGLGANAAAGQAGQNAAFANQAGDLMTQMGNAQAAGTVGSGNAWQQAMGQAGNLAQMYYLSRLYGTQPPPGPMYGPMSGAGVPITSTT